MKASFVGLGFSESSSIKIEFTEQEISDLQQSKVMVYGILGGGKLMVMKQGPKPYVPSVEEPRT